MKDEVGGVIVEKFVGLKSKMKSMKKIDSKETNTAKGVNIATEFNEFKNVLLNKKNYQTQNEKNSKKKSKNQKLGTYEIDNIFVML